MTIKDSDECTDLLAKALQLDGELNGSGRRCWFTGCGRALGLSGSIAGLCRCGGTFCALHRVSSKHVCSFDYKAQGKEELKVSVQKVVASKLVKI